jgi:uncharacterized protein YdeI (YjbR/CyaY-like superfamily)
MYIIETIRYQKQGIKIKPSPKKELIIPIELINKLNADSMLKTAFEKMSEYKRREFSDHISDAKKDSTKERRLENAIIKGVGLNDQYKK